MIQRNNTQSDKNAVSKSWKRKIREIEKEAAGRTLNGNGANPALPPLPCDNDEQNNDDDDGLGTLFSHPYGALPFGNIFMSPLKNKDEVRHNGLGPSMRRLNDEQVLSILAFVDGKSLAKVVQCSRFLYVAGHHDELWRDLTLREYGSCGFNFQESWRDTFVWEEMEKKKMESGERKCRHEPIPMKGIYSDTFFRSWFCRSFTLHPSWLSKNTVAAEDSSQLTLSKFLSEYEEKNCPVVIKGATSEWPAVQKWSRDYLVKNTNGVEFRATSGAAPLPAKFTMESYAKYCDSATEEAPMYLFDRTFADTCPNLTDDYTAALKKSCPFFDDEAEHGHDLFSLLGKKRPDHRWLICGPKRSGSSFHIDPNGTHAWNAPIVGRKRWIFYPPGINPPGVFPSPSGDDVAMPISLGEWFLTYWNDHVKQRSNPDIAKRPLECTVEPGDILFVPHGWWHAVLNLDNGMSVALTQNYVSKSNLPDVLRFLETRQQQISGCRDRGEAIQPENLLEQMKLRLEELRPKLLSESLRGAKEGWQCAAWSDESYSMKNKNVNAEQETNGDCTRDEYYQKKKKLKTSVLDRAKIASSGEDKSDGAVFSFSFLP